MADNTVLPPPPADPRLGRIPEFDERSRNYPIRALISAVQPRSYTWSCLPYLNQGPIGACVGFSIAHEIAARPKVVPVSQELAMSIYLGAQIIDPWPGEDYEGTSVLAGIKTAQKLGYFTEYRWAFGIADALLAIGYKGPGVAGINWYSSMSEPDAEGIIRIAGRVDGGHAILVNGVSLKRGLIRMHNSWGQGWGKQGDCFISIEDFDRLLQEGGEFCVPVIRAAP